MTWHAATALVAFAALQIWLVSSAIAAGASSMLIFAARADHPQRWTQACSQQPVVYCLGQCHHAPSAFGENHDVATGVHSREAVLLGNIARGGARDIGTYQSMGGGEGLRSALRTFSGKVIAELEASGLRGRGGAGFPAARRTRAPASPEPYCEFFWLCGFTLA